jgi:hypothetical protein
MKADRLHPLLPRETPPWSKLYKGRAAVERESGRLKNDWALSPLRVRGLDRVRLHADLTLGARGNAPHPTRGVTLAAIPSNALEAHASPHAVSDCRPCGFRFKGGVPHLPDHSERSPPLRIVFPPGATGKREFR